MTSTSAAEMRALFELVQEIVFIIGLCKELGRSLQLPVVVHEDNESTIYLATQEALRLKRAKHFLMLIHYVKEQVERGYILLKHVASELNIADILTKALYGEDFYNKRDNIQGHTHHGNAHTSN